VFRLVHRFYGAVPMLMIDVDNRALQSFTRTTSFIRIVAFLYFSFRSRPLIIMIMMSRSIHVENTLSMLLWFSRTDDVNGLLRLKSLVPFGVTVSAACCWSGRFHYFCSNSRSARLHAKGTLRLSHFPFIYQCQLRYSF